MVATMAARFCFTIDTEPDDLWSDPDVFTFESAKCLPEFHHMLTGAGARPTYLTTSEVVESDAGRDAMEKCLAEGRCEVGAHFHSWTREWPFDVPDLSGAGGGKLHAMAHQLGQNVEERMLRYTCQAIEGKLGVSPRSFRGGRWSFGPGSPQSLANCGITVDSTMTPGLSWRDERHELLDGPDYTNVSRQPHFLSWVSDAERPGGQGQRVLEIPVGTALIPDRPESWFKGLPVRAISKVCGLVGIPFGFMSLRPATQSLRNMRRVLQSLRDGGSPVWVFMIHSSELIPCQKLPTHGQVESFIERCLCGIRAAVEMGAEPATLEEARQWVIDSDFA